MSGTGARLVVVMGLAAIAASGCHSGGDYARVARSHGLIRPANLPLSAVATIGRAIFFDTTLSASGRVSCASCHQPDHAYGSGADQNVVLSTSDRSVAMVRTTPSLRYVYRTPPFSVGPILADADEAVLSRRVGSPRNSGQPKVANVGARSDRLVAHGGLFWDGRVNTMQDQAMGPLLNPAEMGNRDVASVSEKLERAPYAGGLVSLFGDGILRAPGRLVDEAMFAIARFQIEDSTFHPYTSKFDYYIDGSVSLTPSELHGLQAFDDPARGNCAACHPDTPGADGTPPVLTDYEYEALGVPRNAASAPAREYDLGVCGPVRADLTSDARYCGLFRTPSLRNVATRRSFFHNGVYRKLEDVLAFYNFRETRPELVFPVPSGQGVLKYDDLPARYHGNVDVVDAPFNRKPGDAAPMSEQDTRDIIAFLQTLTDGFRPRCAMRCGP